MRNDLSYDEAVASIANWERKSEKQEAMRAWYMAADSREESSRRHQLYYEWLSDLIGLHDVLIPFKDEQLLRSTDPHLNDLPLQIWDNQDFFVRRAAQRAGIPWSLSDTVCCLKTMAHRRIARLRLNPNHPSI